MSGYSRNYGGSDLRWEFTVYDTAAAITSITTNLAADKAAAGKTQHLVMTYDAAGFMKGYVNGVAVVASPTRTPNANVRSLTEPLRFLDAFNGATSGFPGVVDEAAIYNTVLTAQQVLAHYNAGLGAIFDVPSGTIVLSGSRIESKVPTYRDQQAGQW